MTRTAFLRFVARTRSKCRYPRQPSITAVDHGFSAHYEAANPVRCKEPKEVPDIRGEIHGTQRRVDSRTSGGVLPNACLLSSRATRRRSSGLMLGPIPIQSTWTEDMSGSFHPGTGTITARSVVVCSPTRHARLTGVRSQWSGTGRLSRGGDSESASQNVAGACKMSRPLSGCHWSRRKRERPAV
jgi:hypothetical protein